MGLKILNTSKAVKILLKKGFGIFPIVMKLRNYILNTVFTL